VPLVEEGLLNDTITDEIAKRYLHELINIDIDTLIMGCTHYPLIRETIAKIMGGQVRLVNPAEETARELHSLLTTRGLLNDNEADGGKYQLYVSDGAEKFKQIANSIITSNQVLIKTVNIEE
jgi:glutamate racemase